MTFRALTLRQSEWKGLWLVWIIIFQNNGEPSNFCESRPVRTAQSFFQFLCWLAQKISSRHLWTKHIYRKTKPGSYPITWSVVLCQDVLRHRKFFISIYHSSESSAFSARWLASSEVIIQVYSPPNIKRRTKLLKSIIFQLIVADKVVFGPIFSTFVLYTKTIIHLGAGK